MLFIPSLVSLCISQVPYGSAVYIAGWIQGLSARAHQTIEWLRTTARNIVREHEEHQTALGEISQLVMQAASKRSPLEKRLTRVAGQLVWLTIAIAALVVAAGLEAAGMRL